MSTDRLTSGTYNANNVSAVAVVVHNAGADAKIVRVVPLVPVGTKCCTESTGDANNTPAPDDPVYYLIVTIIMPDGVKKKSVDRCTRVTTELCSNITKTGTY